MKTAMKGAIFAGCFVATAHAQIGRSIAHSPFHYALQPNDRTNGFELVMDDRRNERDGNDWTVFYVYSHRSTARIIFEKNIASDDRWFAEQFAHAWAVQPDVVRETVHHVDLRILPETVLVQAPSFSWLDVNTEHDNYYGNARQRSKTVFFPISMWELDFRTPDNIDYHAIRPGFEEVMTHEMCHALDYELRINNTCSLTEALLWRDAREKDDAYITNYARDEPPRVSEDFAETCAAYILTRYSKRLPPSVKQYMDNVIPEKVAFFDKLFNTASITGVLDADPIWESGA